MKRFLVSRLSALGDVVCTLPVAAALRAGHPGCEVEWLVDRRFAPVLECASSVDRFHVVPARPLETVALVRSLGPFDAALDMQGLLKSAWPLAFAKANQKVGFHWQREGARAFTSPVLPDPTSLHVVDQYVDVARVLGGCGETADFGLCPVPDDTAACRAKLVDQGWDESRLLLVNANAGWESKRWPAQKFARVAEWADDQGVPVAFLGAPGDAKNFEAVCAHMRKRPIDMVGKTSVRELIALVGLASVHLGGDTGSSHIAAALGLPAVGVYTATRPERSCPYGNFARCFDGRVMEITAEAVCAKLDEALRK